MDGDLLGLGFEPAPSQAPSSTAQPPTEAAPPTVAPPAVAPPAVAPPAVAPPAVAPAPLPAAEVSPPSPQKQEVTSAPETKPEVSASDADLKQIEAKFGGQWKLVRSDPYDEYLKAVGINFFNRKVAGSGAPEEIFLVKDGRIYISFRSTFHNQNYVFTLGETVENLVEKSRQSVFTTFKDGKLILQMTPVEEGWGKTQEVVWDVNNLGEHEVIYTCGSATCRRYFAKMLAATGLEPPPLT
ncbi:fatty acid-binding protein homolog 8-like [Physella acuta]|uniref:fatty acid-binding protein homolog 8-like n=1 Tax=Physella acuta TaxID=109671 RepID=UPI0027DB0467|nr:fatty acid-binding protein homolog 8-like [Physella acuta]